MGVYLGGGESDLDLSLCMDALAWALARKHGDGMCKC